MTETDKKITKVVYFYAEWCEYCHTMKGVFDRDLNTATVTLECLNIDHDPEIMEEWSVRNIPIAIALDENGSRVSSLVGAPDSQHVERWLAQTGLYRA